MSASSKILLRFPICAWLVLQALLVVPILASTGCHIFGAAPVPCSNDNAEQECTPEQICLDGTCQARPQAPSACPAPPRDVTGEPRAVVLEATDSAGVDATGPLLLGLDEELVVDLSCAPDCEVLSQPAAPARAPLLDGVGAAGLDGGPLTAADARPDTSGPFALEAVFRSPSSLDARQIAGVTNGPGTGWRLVGGGGLTSLFVGTTEVILTAASEAVWTHLLCVVDPDALGQGDAAGVLCSVDGSLPALPPTRAGTYAPADAALVLGDAPGNDGAVAFVRLWRGRPPELPDDGAAALAALLAEGRARLLRYVGVHVESAGSILISNVNSAPRVIDLPATGQRPRELALVGGAWPRLAEVDGARGILFEPTSENLLGDVARDCGDRTRGPTGREDACLLVDSIIADTAVPRGTTITFSAYSQKGATDLLVVFDGEGGGLGDRTVLCSLIDDDDTCLGGFETFSGTLEDVGGFQRFSVTMTLNFEVTSVEITSTAHDAVWSPQLEVGTVATSPIPFFVSFEDRFTSTRLSDAVLLDEVGLGNTSELSLEARVLRADEEIFPVTVLDDEELDDGFLQLVAAFPAPGEGVATASLLGRVDAKDLDEAATDISSPPLTLGAHVGAEVASCEPCDEVGPVRAGRMQAELVLFLGPGAVVERASVVSRGAEPLPTALDLDVGLPPVAPCLDGQEPLFIFAACPGSTAGGALCEDVRTRWDGARTAQLSAAAFPGELAASGRFTTDLVEEDFFGTLYLEVRFETPAAGPGGDLVLVRDRAGTLASFSLRAHDDGTYSVLVEAGGAVRAVTRVAAAEWNQLACLFDEPVRCQVNLDEPLTFGELGVLQKEPLLSAAVGDSVGGARIASARAFYVDRPADQDDATALLSRRALESFGLLVRDRRAAVFGSEARGASSFTSLADVDRARLVLRRIGAHWPRVEERRRDDGRLDVERGLEYAADPGGTDALDDDLLDDLGRGGRAGPHPSLPAVLIDEDVELPLPVERDGGVVSVFVSELDDGDAVAVESGTTRLTLSGATGAVDIQGDGVGGVDDYGAWRRVWLRVGASQGSSLSVSGRLLLSGLQRDRRAVRPGPPALDDELPGDGLRLVTGDLTTSAASVVNLGLDSDTVDGPFFSLRRSSGSSSRSVSLLADGPELLWSLEERQGLELPSVTIETFGLVSPLDDLTWWWRDNVSVLRLGDGTMVAQPAAVLVEPANRVLVGGGGRVRLRSLSVRRGDL